MIHIGFSLIDSSSAEVASFGDMTSSVQIVEMLALPNGDHVHCPTVGATYGQWKFVERWLDDNPQSQWYKSTGSTIGFDGDKVIVTVNYEATPSIVPQQVSPRQARLALLSANLLTQATAAVDAGDQQTQITWEFASYFDRNDPLIIGIGTKLNLTSAQIDDLFRAASGL
jgi:hypothetical protein